jgi:hypothetical protein
MGECSLCCVMVLKVRGLRALGVMDCSSYEVSVFGL